MKDAERIELALAPLAGLANEWRAEKARRARRKWREKQADFHRASEMGRWLQDRISDMRTKP